MARFVAGSYGRSAEREAKTIIASHLPFRLGLTRAPAPSGMLSLADRAKN